MKLDPLKKPPINTTPSRRISSSLYKSAIAKLSGVKSFIPRETFKALHKAGLTRGLGIGSSGTVDRKNIIKAEALLSKEGLIKHKSLAG